MGMLGDHSGGNTVMPATWAQDLGLGAPWGMETLS